MRKATDCVTKAVKAKGQCKKTTNLLVYKKECQERSEAAKHRYTITPECATQAKRIRVCTGAELKKMCPPKPCPCPAKSTHVSAGLLGPLKFALKAALAGALVFLTVEAGLWGESETSEALYYTIYKMLLPKVCKDEEDDYRRETFLDRNQHKEVCEAYQALMETPIPRKKEEECCSPEPQTNEKLTFLFQSKWNQFVTCAFACFLNLPAMITQKMSGESKPEEEEEGDPEVDECED